MGQLIGEGVSSFKLFMAYPGVLMVDDATIFKAMSQAAKYGGLICMHAENGGAIDVIVQRALAEGKRAPEISRADAAHDGGRRSDEPRHRAGGNGRSARVHRASFVQRGARKSARGARPRPAGLRRNVPAISVSFARENGRAGIRGREIRFHAAAARKVAPGKIVAGADAGHAAGGVHRPLPVLLQGTEGTGQGRLSRKFPMAGRASSTG